MSDAVLLSEQDVKKLIAEKFGVEEKDVIRSQYSYVVKVKPKDS